MGELAQSFGWQQNEAELVTELQAGSELAFDYLVTYYHNSVYNLVYGILSDAADAADVTQEVFLRVFRGIRGFRRSSSLKTWIYRVAVRQALNQRRWCWRHHRQQISIEAEEEANHSIFELRDNEATPFEQLATQEVQSAVRQALAAVPAPFRSAVILRDLEGLSYEEVAEVLDVSVGTIKSRILRGRRMLKKLLDPLLRAPAADMTASRDRAGFAGQRQNGSSRNGSGQAGSVHNGSGRHTQRAFEIGEREALARAGAGFAGAEEATE
jgi:RNA polymerase sigma-70 factor, ECF subfamily